ncbi:MAG TPA: serine/threonine-protein kinase [Pirellulales bacterium]
MTVVWSDPVMERLPNPGRDPQRDAETARPLSTDGATTAGPGNLPPLSAETTSRDSGVYVPQPEPPPFPLTGTLYPPGAHQVFEATVDEHGRVALNHPARFTGVRRALVVVLAEPGETRPGDAESAASPYRFERPLGSGGMGETFVATQLSTGLIVCVKRLRLGVSDAVIEQEMQSLQRVVSPYVARYLDAYRQHGTLHLVTQYVAGPTLAQRLVGGLTAREIVRLGAMLMRGLEAIHAQRVIHCDLKPQNVVTDFETIIGPQSIGWIARIIDFGLAVLDEYDSAGRHTGQGRLAGTPAYMSPEQILGATLSPACDVYAAGLILWESIAGRYAFSGNIREIMAAKAEQKTGLRIDPLPGLPPAVLEAIERCTDPDPTRRPTASEAAPLFEAAFLDATDDGPSEPWRRNQESDGFDQR